MSRNPHRRARGKHSARSATRPARPLRIEPLEDRRLLAVITVDTIEDVIDFNDGRTSLREAVFAANTVAGPDEIRFDFGHDGPATILLTQGELKITDALTITGNGAELLTIDASGNNPTMVDFGGARAFTIDDGKASNLIHVVIGELTITGGNVATGGAIQVSESLAVRNVAFRDNISRFEGAAIFAEAGSVLSLELCTFVSNGSRGGRGGGAIYSEGDSLRVDSCTFRYNSGNFGGAIYCIDAELRVEATLFQYNSGFFGGAIYYEGPSADLLEITFVDNDAVNGGGAVIESLAASVRRCNFSFNTASAGNGGGLYVAGHVEVSEVEFRDNWARHGGGAALREGHATFADCVFERNFASGEGGGLYVPRTTQSSQFQSVASVSRCEFTENSAHDGGGVALGRGVISNSWIQKNSASRFGGGLLIRGDSTVIDSTISENVLRDPYSFGAGVYALGADVAGQRFVNLTISANRSAGFFGGLYVESGAPVVIGYCTIVDNRSLLETAGLDVAIDLNSANSALITHTLIAGNTRLDGTDADFRARGPVELFHSLIGMTDGVFLAEAPVGSPDADGNLIGGPLHGPIDPLLAPLADNGGPTPTHALLPGSPAIDAGDPTLRPGVDGTPEFDQRGEPFSRVAGARIDIGAVEQRNVPFIVDTTADESDGDYSRGDLSLREAIELANAQSGPDLIRFDFGHDGPATILLTQGELKITDSLTITGNGADLLTIDASGNNPSMTFGQGSRVFRVIDGDDASSIAVTVEHLTITGGDTTAPGGAIHSLENLALRSVTFRNNFSLAEGGAVYAGVGTVTTLENCEFVSNGSRGGQGGGGVYSSGAALRVQASVFQQNFGGTGGAIRYAGPTVEVVDSVFHDNHAGTGGGIALESFAAILRDSEFSLNTAYAIGGGGLYASGALDASNTSFRNNSAGSGGGAMVHAGRVQFTACSFEQNFASTEGGGVGVSGPVFSRPVQREILFDNCLVIENTARDGGGIEIDDGVVQNTLISGNSAGRFGGGLYVRGDVQVLNSTISNNETRDDYSFGAGVYAVQKTDRVSAQFVNATISQNRSAGFFGGLYIESPEPILISHSTIVANSSAYETAGLDLVATGDGANSAVLFHTIIAGNVRLDGVQADLRVRGGAELTHNLIGMPVGDFLQEAPVGSPDAHGNLVGGTIYGPINPLLAPLADNGGPTPTHALLPGSPAIDAGDPTLRPGVDGTPEFDQRGEPFSRVAGARIDIGAVEQRNVPFIVDTTADESDGDYSRGDLSLREAIELANAQSGPDLIRFDFGHDGPATILLTQGELKITDSLMIAGNGAELLTIDASGSDPTVNINDGNGNRIFDIDDGDKDRTIEVTISAIALTGGDALGDGGAIRSREHLSLNAVTLADNSSRSLGGAVYSGPGATLVVRDSTIADGASGKGSGGIHSLGESTLIERSTIEGNFGIKGGGLYSQDGDVTIVDSSLLSNWAGEGGGAWILSPRVVVQGSLVADNLVPFGNGGGLALTGNAEILDSEIRGNKAGNGGGAWFGSGSFVATNITVNDNDARSSGGGLYVAKDAELHLSHSVFEGNSAGLYGGGLALLSRGASVVDASQFQRNEARGGGGMLIFSGTLKDSTLVDNTATNGESEFSAGQGGGLLVSGPALIVGCTIARNHAVGGESAGGGVYLSATNLSSFDPFTATFVNTTIVENRSAGRAGGVAVGSKSSVRLLHCTIADNETATPEAAAVEALDDAARFEIEHCIIANNISGNSVPFDLQWNDRTVITYSLVGHQNGTVLPEAPVGSPDANGNLVGGPIHGAIDPRLAPLADNGGPTPTRQPLPDSPAISAGNPSLLLGGADAPQFDQRGGPFLRVLGDRIDIGAVEFPEAFYVVDTLADEDDGDHSTGDFSLREAIALANSQVGQHTIGFHPSLFADGPARLELSRGELLVADDLRLIGPGANLLTIDASGNDSTPDIPNGDGARVLNIDDGDSRRTARVLIVGLGFTGGDASGDGGAIRTAENLTLESVRVWGNASQSSGGGVFARGDVVEITQSTIEDNVARNGGGLAVISPQAIVVDSTLAGNRASARGGGAWSGGGRIEFAGSTVHGNASIEEGGGLFVQGTAAIVDSVISENTANRGGGVRGEGFVEVSRSVISMNVAARDGGGASLDRSSIEDSTISHNKAGSGGGLYVTKSTIVRVTIEGNSADGGGGGMKGGDNVVRDSVVRGNAAGQEGRGGGIDVFGGTLTIERTELASNTAAYGGGLYYLDHLLLSAPLSMDGCLVHHNTATYETGGIHLQAVGVVPIAHEIRNTTIAHNSASNNAGGIKIDGNTSVLVVGCTISNNVTWSAISIGAGVFITTYAHAGDIRFINTTISGNHSAGFAGGVYLEASRNVLFAHCTVVQNSSALEGAGFYLHTYEPGQIELTHSIIAGNLRTTGEHDDVYATQPHVYTYNLIGHAGRSGLAEAPVGSPDANGNLIGGASHGPIDPLLGPLQPGYGPAATHEPQPGSPAVDAGDPTLLAGVGSTPRFDQRGEPLTRVDGQRVDIGAVETIASPWLVSTLDDEDDGDLTSGRFSLREAVRLSNEVPGVQAIEFAPALWADGPATILLKQGGLQVRDAVEIRGPGADLLTIDASGSDPTPEKKNGDGSRIFDVSVAPSAAGEPAGAAGTVTIAGLTLTGGDVYEPGGAIRSTSDLLIDGSRIVDNRAGLGGGVWLQDATLTIVGSEFSKNSSSSGGGVAVSSGHLIVVASAFTENAAAGRGGGADVQGQSPLVSIRDSTFDRNSALGPGGGLLVRTTAADAMIVVERTFVTGNVAGSGYAGGGIYVDLRDFDSTILFNRVSVTQNSIPGSGGGVALRLAPRSTATIVDSDISDNTAGLTSPSGSGGGLWVAMTRADSLRIERTTINGNKAGGHGGGLYFTPEEPNTGFTGLVSIVDSTIAANSALASGGGVAALWMRLPGSDGPPRPRVEPERSALLVGNGPLQHEGTASAAVADDAPVHLQIVRSTIHDNSAGWEGGGLLLHGLERTAIRDSTISLNRAGGSGGGLARISSIIAPSAQETLAHNVTISGNTANGNGGGVYVELRGGGAVALAYATVTANTSDANRDAAGAGGGVFIARGELTLNHTIVADNRDRSSLAPDLAGLIGSILTPRFSLIGTNAGSGLSPALVGSPDINGNLVGGSQGSAINPRLESLAENGGATRTHALRQGTFPSPAIDAGDPAIVPGLNGAPEFDQRGAPFTRLAGGRIDIGAYEVQPPTGALRADFNLDGRVDGADFLVWQQNLGRTSGATLRHGDATADGDVDVHDLAVWRATFGRDDSAETVEAISVQPSAVGQSRAGQGAAAPLSRALIDGAIAALFPTTPAHPRRTPYRPAPLAAAQPIAVENRSIARPLATSTSAHLRDAALAIDAPHQDASADATKNDESSGSLPSAGRAGERGVRGTRAADV